MPGQPEMVADYACVCGEGPLWHPTEQRVYWTDIETGRMFRYDPATGSHEQFYEGDVVGGFTIQANGDLLLFMARGAVRIWSDGRLRTVIDEIPEELDSRFNDVIADPRGRVYCGTMPSKDHMGSLYRLDTNGTLTKLFGDVGCANGMGFTRNRRRMYFTDTPTLRIDVFYYDVETGAITDRRPFAYASQGEGLPDGMTVDSEGSVWSARWDGSRIVRYDLSGAETERVMFPAKKVSSLAFGGPDLTDIYATTAGGDKKSTDGDYAGALFRVRADVKGVPEFPSRVCL